MNKRANKRILLTGGGTGGSVTPLLALLDDLQGCEFLWIGTEKGPEREMVEKAGLEFESIRSGKLRRYFSIENFFDIFRFFYGFLESFTIINKFRPRLVLTAGSYVSVGVAIAAWIRGVPVFVHQQDARAGLANKLMAPFAKKISVTFEQSVKDYGEKAICVGNPIRKEFQDNKIDKRTAKQKLGLRNEKPIVLVMGGGTGALAINELVKKSLNELTKFCQIIHLTGKDKDLGFAKISSVNDSYKNFEFLDIEGMIKVYKVADIVVSRCGMASLTELCYYKKPSILIPMPASHQEDNAKIFSEKKAAVLLDQNKLEAVNFLQTIKNTLQDQELLTALSKNISTVIKTNKNHLIEIIKKELNN